MRKRRKKMVTAINRYWVLGYDGDGLYVYSRHKTIEEATYKLKEAKEDFPNNYLCVVCIVAE